ncbi:MAG TPA: hypothetical protein VFE22_03095, partial [Edaphobacter sp.]|nr:hypothetical protein [Edaphobacter sp.]
MAPEMTIRSSAQYGPSAALRRLFVSISILIIGAFGVSQARGQVDRGALSGTVTDSAGRTLPQTHITATLGSNRLKREVTSHTDGS